MISSVALAAVLLSAPSGDVDHARTDRATVLPEIVASPLRATVDARALNLEIGNLQVGNLRVADPDAATRLRIDVDPTLVDLARQAAASRGTVRLGGIPLPGGHTVDLDLTPVDPFTPDATFVVIDQGGRERTLPRPDVVALAGTVAGDPDGDAFLAFGPAGVEGWIRVDGIAFGVSDGVQGGPAFVHRLDALPPTDPELAANFCGTDLLAPVPGVAAADEPVRRAAMGPALPTRDRDGEARLGFSATGTGCELVRLAIDTDQELVGLFGGDTEATLGYLATLMAATSSIFERDHGMRLQANYIRLWLDEDPWNAGGTADELYAFRDLWQAEMGHIDRDLAHFLSGRGLGGGVAWLPGLCGSYGYGLSANLNGSFPYPIENNSGQNWDLMVFSHELGHNVGCPHTHSIGVDDCAGGDCSVTPNGTIMSYCHICPGGLANVRMEFCPENILNVQDTLAGLACDYTVTPDTVARDDAARILPGETVVLDVLGNDAGLDCGDLLLGDFDATSTLGGSIELVEGGGVFGRPVLRYTPPVTTATADAFGYEVTDLAGTTLDTATVEIGIDNPRPPVRVIGDLPGVLGRYYALESPSVIPDFELLEPYAEGVWSRIDAPSTGGDFGDTGRADEVGVVWEGWIDIPADGSWTFGTESDDGSRLWIGGEMVVDNDGLHGMVERTGTIALLAGRHPIRVEFFENGGGAGCIVRLGGPDMGYATIPDAMWSYGGTLLPPADLNGDGEVDGSDLGLLFSGWLQPGPTDLDGDGTTDGTDMGLLLAAWTG